MEKQFDFTSTTDWAAPLVALAYPYASLVLVGLIVLPLLVALYSRHAFSVLETFVLVVLVFFAGQQGEAVMALALSGAAMLTALWGFQRQQEDRRYWQMRNELSDMSARVEIFLDALDRRSRYLDLTFAASPGLRDEVEDEPEPSMPARRHNGMVETHSE